MEDQVCPRCRTTKYRNPSLKLLVNVCGHSLCENCVDLLFLKGSGSCPECQIPLRRSNFRVQLFEDPGVEKEVDIRKRVLREYNKKEDDFTSADDYNDYLEEIEEIVFNLVNGVATIETNRRIEQYKKENREQILRNKVRSGRTEAELEEIIQEEKRYNETRREEAEREEAETKKRKARAKEALLDELMFSQGDASNIIKTFAKRREATCEKSASNLPKRATMFSTGIKFGSGDVRVVEVREGPKFVYRSPEVVVNGPVPPGRTGLVSGAYMAYMRDGTIEEAAGGFDMTSACQRAMQEAFCGLYYSPREPPPDSPVQT